MDCGINSQQQQQQQQQRPPPPPARRAEPEQVVPAAPWSRQPASDVHNQAYVIFIWGSNISTVFEAVVLGASLHKADATLRRRICMMEKEMMRQHPGWARVLESHWELQPFEHLQLDERVT